MVRNLWVGVAFVCGSVLGVIGTRMLGNRPAVVDVATRAPAEPGDSAARIAAAPPAVPDATVGSAPAVTRAVPAPNQSPAVSAHAAGQATSAPPADDGAPVRRIEVGDAFHQQIDRPSVPGFPNEFGDAHRALERETRDDSWAYQMEAEIQNSLTAFVSTGELQVRFLECRTTICEMRLFASDAHRNSMDTWQQVMQSQPWIRRVRMEGMGLSGAQGGSEGLWIFRKTPQP
jgi:hypothetical protein